MDGKGSITFWSELGLGVKSFEVGGFEPYLLSRLVLDESILIASLHHFSGKTNARLDFCPEVMELLQPRGDVWSVGVSHSGNIVSWFISHQRFEWRRVDRIMMPVVMRKLCQWEVKCPVVGAVIAEDPKV